MLVFYIFLVKLYVGWTWKIREVLTLHYVGRLSSGDKLKLAHKQCNKSSGKHSSSVLQKVSNAFLIESKIVLNGDRNGLGLKQNVTSHWAGLM